MNETDKKNQAKKLASADTTVLRNNEATRVRPAANAEDKTRFKQQQKPPVDDKTQFRPKQRASQQSQAGDKTRFRPQQPNTQQAAAKSTTANTSAQSEAITGQHQILKNRFILEKVLGVGGMGVVYKARDRLKVEAQDRDPYVAIKVLSEEFKSHPQAFISLQRESRKTQRISHPNTVKVFDFDRDGDVVFMTMEYMEGKPLDQLIQQYKATGLPRDDAWEIIDGLCSALIYAHEENIVHSDFKPGNVFIINNSTPKIFDFGIARAVASVDALDRKGGDKTVFDAGNLGALTPAYASYEMLVGEEPDVRDDVYALGCVAYEVLTGEHPYQKVPADEAFNRGMKPKRIAGIKKHQWKAIQKALELKREDRTASVEQFHRELTYVFKPGFKSVAALLILLTAGIIGFVQYTGNNGPEYSENDIRNELEYKIRLDLHKKEIARLLENPTFSLDWEDNIWTEYSGVVKLLNNREDEWLAGVKNKIYDLYISKIDQFIADKRFARTKILISNAKRYTEDPQNLADAGNKLAQAIEQNRKNRAIAMKQQRQQELQVAKQKQEQKKRLDKFNLAMSNVNQQLQCTSRLKMRELKVAVNKLRSLDSTRYKKAEPRIVRTLSACITSIGKLHPERALENKKSAQRIFRGNRMIAAINIKPRDACDISLAGLGARGTRTTCRDKIRGKTYGPAMVVIPGSRDIKPFAIGKYEVSVKDFNEFCRATKSCPLINKNGELPVTGISITKARKYLKWLSKKTRQKYRLPTKQEWVYAASSKRLVRDPNRNCLMSTRGIVKGNELVTVNTGKQNPWGVVNYIGNAREWVYDSGRKLIAIGGSYTDAMDKCDINLSVAHNGSADALSGFRVVREVKSRN